MKINGFQKLTLLDFPGKMACTIFTAGCNMRCPFCHNAALVTHIDKENTFDTEEILDFLKQRQGILEGVAFTGGEPLLQPDIKEFMAEVKKLGYAIKLDTNGTFPEKLKELVNGGLVGYVAMDIKNSKAKYKLTAGAEDLDLQKIEESIEFLINSNMDFEFRTTVVNEFHTLEDIQDIVVWIKGAHNYYLQNFVDSGDLIGCNLSPVSRDTLRKMREKAAESIPCVEIRGI